MAELRSDYVLDVRGEGCPFPLLKTKKQITTIEAGKVLEVVSTDPMSVDNIQGWAKDHGHEIIKVLKGNGEIHIFIKKK